MSASYRVFAHDGARAFLARSEPWLLAHEDRNNLVLSLAYDRAAEGVQGTDALFATVEEGGAIVGCVLRTPPYKVLLTAMPIAAAEAVADRLAGAYDSIPAVLGPEALAEAVAEAWVTRCGGRHRGGMRQRIYRLDRVTAHPSTGTLRQATPADMELSLEWSRGFARDVGSLFAASERTLTTWIDRGHLFLWEDDGRPVSTAVAHGRTPSGVRIGYVYTPPEHRRRGYGSALVAALSQRMLDGNARFCVLYTDLANPTSNAIYQRIGYRPLEDVRDVDIVADQVSS